MKDIEKKPERRTKKKRKKSLGKMIIVFLIYEFIVAAVTTPLIVFYGPFENVKRTMVGTAMATFTHQYIATTFLSKDEIDEILKSSKSGETTSSESENLGGIKVAHVADKGIDRYDIHTKKFDGYILEIKDPTRIKIGYTKKLGEVGQRTSEIAEENGAIAAINGGGFTDRSSNGKLWAGTGAYPEGIVISDGKTVYSDINANERVNVTAFTADGKLIVGDHTLEDLRKQGVVEAVSFRNTLIINGKTVAVEDEGLNPRTAIGQKEDGTIIMVVIDGRKGLKPGATLKELQNILLQQGAVNASNLDGGSSSTMYFNGEVINDPCDWNGERTIATALYVKP
ncbi:phosphodiester glycosidase family protein [Clostridium sp. A1-XYC3]|uniref:Phosphodiester glycosidase family protein n=1 Tax=Clostridium tanneri TaxID=3037988 RepID=A0ABU4JNP6_9CLOT|nr:phosphodiester glycosidase family protein [Clostridium sp. A1-XYC3]MDW8799771.1 phosphodiester glycosidase family protein [Clostridium sp. A1-XYC3]